MFKITCQAYKIIDIFEKGIPTTITTKNISNIINIITTKENSKLYDIPKLWNQIHSNVDKRQKLYSKNYFTYSIRKMSSIQCRITN